MSSDQRWHRTRSLSGLIILVALLTGVMFTVVGMNRTFNAIAASETVNPDQLSQHISTSLSILMITTPVAVCAFIVWIVATMKIWRLRG
jgi:biopolymer transport protein ExbB/TolQ